VESHAVVIASTRRPDVLAETVDSILSGIVLPSLILISVPDEQDVAPRTAALPVVKVILARRGLCHQINDAVKALPPEIKLVTLFDDDVEVARDYLERVAGFLAEHPEVVVCDGLVVRDGGITRQEAMDLLRQPAPDDRSFHQHTGIYGGNSTSRVEMLRRHPFDERLPLYAWLCDLDYGIRCSTDGQVGTHPGCRFVHLMVSSGRISGTRFGFSQIMNPYYLFRKRVITLRKLLQFFWMRSVASNVFNGARRGMLYDYRGRLKGNLLAFASIIHGRVEPERVTHLE
jgi:Glycosyl transferase family 2